MKINVNGGHSNMSPGAAKYLNEVLEDRAVKNALIKRLKSLGNTVTDSTSDAVTSKQVLIEQATKANNSKASVAISIHFNAGGGTGTEVWYYTGSSVGKKYAEKVALKISSKLGLRNRGAKSSTELYWLKHTAMPAILVEVCFVDSLTDSKSYKKITADGVAKAIAEAIC